MTADATNDSLFVSFLGIVAFGLGWFWKGLVEDIVIVAELTLATASVWRFAVGLSSEILDVGRRL